MALTSTAPLIVGAVALAEDVYRIHETRRWIDETSKTLLWSQWINGTSKTPLFWYQGRGGAGKSALAQMVIPPNPALDACTNYHHGCSTSRNSVLQAILAAYGPNTFSSIHMSSMIWSPTAIRDLTL